MNKLVVGNEWYQADAVLNALPLAVCVTDRHGVIVRYNDQALALWATEEPPKPGDPARLFGGSHRLYWPDGRPIPLRDRPTSEAILNGRSFHDVEMQIERRDGSRIWISVDIEPMRDDRGVIVGCVNVFRDISVRKQSEMTIRQSQQLLDTIVETTPECIKVVAPDGTLLRMNPAGLAMVEAQTVSAVEGANVIDLIAPEYRDIWWSNHQRVCGGENVIWEFDLIGRQGRRRHMETTAVPLRLPDGTCAHLALTRDITERKKAERSLLKNERHLRELLDAIPSAVYTTDATGRLTFYNQAAIGFAGRIPQIGMDEWCITWRLYRPDGRLLPHNECPMAVALQENRAIRGGEAIAERPDGTRVPFLAFATPLTDIDGRPSGAVNMLVDITERERAEQSQRVLINELNHRVKNTLSTVQAIAVQTMRDPATEQAYLAFEGRLLALSRAHEALTREHWEGIRVADIIDRSTLALDRFEVDGDNARVSPRMALALAMVLHELGANASRFGALSNPDGRVRLGWQGVNGRLRLEWIETNGPKVTPPERHGYGWRLIARGLARELSADVRWDFAEAGVTCKIDAAL